jgi:hypothetical protein
MNRFDLEEKITQCWGITDEIDLLRRSMLDHPKQMSEDEVDNFLLGLQTIYNRKFEELFAVYEQGIKEEVIK